MKPKRIVAGLLVTVLLAGSGYLTLLSFGVFASVSDYRPVPPGHQEIVFLAPATSGESWERLVAAVDALHDEALQAGRGKVRLHVAKERAFTALTADVPEVSLWLDGCEDAKLWIRWYKLSAESNSEEWIARLTKRSPPPLAIIGGDTSGRALKVALALEKHRADWKGPWPLLLFTTATADRYVPNNLPRVSTTQKDVPTLIDVYKGRSFRFSFTNSRMAAALLGFIRTHVELWPKPAQPKEMAEASAKALVMAQGPFAAAGLATAVDELLATHLYTLKWDDDNYSVDLADRFGDLFWKQSSRHVNAYQIQYSVGDFYQPNPHEAFVVGQLLPDLKAARDSRQVMLLPAETEPARRFLRTVVRRSDPRDLKNLVVLAGDSLNFNAIYRDRNVAWNIQDMPVTLVTFIHRNPVDEGVGFTTTSASGATGTEDLLLYRDMLETLLLTAYQGQQLSVAGDQLVHALHSLSWADGRVRLMAAGEKGTALFNPADGNRKDGTGEHIIVLRPDFTLGAEATIEVWQLQGHANLRKDWIKKRTLEDVTYDGLPPKRKDS